MSKTTGKSAKSVKETKATGAAAAKSPAHGEHVPEAAENFEHTIRRLVSEKEKERAKSFGLYR